MYEAWNEHTREVYGESSIFADCDRVNLLFPAEKILRVYSSCSGEEYFQGKDWLFDTQTEQLIRPEGSRIPRLADEDLHPDGPFYPAPDAKAVPGGADGRPLRFDYRDFFAKHQFSVDYVAEKIDFPLDKILAPLANRLPRLRRKLSQRGKEIKISWLGDSISEGYNASGYHKFSPFQPPFAELAARKLGEKFNIFVDLRNHSLSGAQSEYPFTCQEKWIAGKPDLQVIAFGMNDFSMPYGVDGYIANIGKIMDVVHEASPETEFLLIASMSGHPLWKNTPLEKAAEYASRLRELAKSAGENTALADLFSLWQKVMERKSFMDLTGNGVNHPNDFGHRILSTGVSFVLENL